jgi:hypothetical protein
MRNLCKSKLLLTTFMCFALTAPLVDQAAAQYRMIRTSEYCEVVRKELTAKVNASLYKSALQKKKAGTLNRKSRARLEDVERWREGMRYMKCKNIP